MENVDPTFTKIVPQIVNDVMAVAAQIDANWKTALISRRFSSDGSSMGKLRIELPKGDWDKSQRISIKVLDIIDNTWEKMNKKKKHKVFYGFQIAINSDGSHKIEYNYDPNCIDDPSFVDW